MNITSLFLFLVLEQNPVIQLDDIEVTGNVRKPNTVELEKSHLDEKVEKAALSNLTRLENDLTKPLKMKDLSPLKSSP